MDVKKTPRLPRPTGTNKKYTFFICGFITVLGCTLYQTIISPILDPQPWKDYRDKLYDKLPKQNED
ncbi:uncharacterized protein LOC141525614 [Cotesia typhae]|uniref:uncharacterized protein LOC141525614 n=1 Tax=Cotesia typhae TaxID=2053667 RepID=UPI003D69D969